MEWHVKNGSGSNSWEWDMYSGSSGSERYERLPMAEWAGSDQEVGFNISKEFHFKAHNAMDHENSSMSLIGGSGLSDVVSGVDRGVKILKNENGDMKGGWLVDSGMANNNNQKSNSNGNGLFMGCLGGGNSEESSVYTGIGSSMSDLQGDSLTCLKLGKRQYYEDSNASQSKPMNAISLQQSLHHPLTALNSRGFSNVASPMVSKKTRANSSSNAPVPRCQVEGCNVLLTDAKEYHKRHKVCESHSKTPKVIVNSLEQRFCQQCSRFHQISEFDDTKRSCRRRLAGHNERRRKSSSDALHNSSQEDKRLISAMGERFCYGSYSVPWFPSSRRALSLLSSQKPSWITSTDIQEDLSFRSNAALNELIAQNRAQSHSRYTDYEHRGLSKPVSMFQGAGQTMQDQQDMQDNMEICRVMPELRSLEINNVASGRMHLYNSHELKEHNYGLIDSNVVARPTLDLMQHHSNSLYALHSRSNASSSSSSSEEKSGFWKSVEGVEIE